jgi:hypothetical protein
MAGECIILKQTKKFPKVFVIFYFCHFRILRFNINKRMDFYNRNNFLFILYYYNYFNNFI